MGSVRFMANSKSSGDINSTWNMGCRVLLRVGVQCQAAICGISFTNALFPLASLTLGDKNQMEKRLKVKITRDVPVANYPFTDYFKGFENVDAVKRIFGDKTKSVLRNLRVEFAGRRGYMGVSEMNGHLLISASYLKTGDIVDIYLDIIHELVHVRQHMEGKELFDDNFSYVERPTEIEAYQFAVDEARNLGLGEERICEYLRTEWITDEEFQSLARAVGVKCEQQ